MRHVVAAVALLVLTSPALAQAPKGRKVAFLVGVGAYKFNFQDLGTAPERDVTALAKELREGGFEVVTLTGSGRGADRATKKNLEARFAAMLDGDGNADKALGKGDLLLVHLCGHGFQVEALDPATGKKEEQPFFCPFDAVPDKPDTMVSLNGLIAATEPRGATALFLIDACREAKDPNRGTRGGVQGNKVTLRKNTAVLFACGQGQMSHQSEKAGGGHGLFTYAVLKTIKGGNGKVSWSQLVSGVEQWFQSDECRRMIPAGQAQNPVEAKGELGYTELLTPDPLARDVQAVLDACVFRGTPGEFHYRKVAPGRIDAWRKAAEAGSPNGMLLYADCLLNGFAVTKDERAALALYRKAEKLGVCGAMNQLGYMHCEGLGGLAKNYAEGLGWYQKAADAGWVRSKTNLGQMYLNGFGTPKNVRKAGELLQQAAADGDSLAMFTLGDLYFGGADGWPKDSRKAADLVRTASDLGVPTAMAIYGAAHAGYITLPGVARNDREAVRLFKAAVEWNDAEGHRFLAYAYAFGQGGLPKDAAEYRRHLEKAADLGSEAAKAEWKQLTKK